MAKKKVIDFPTLPSEDENPKVDTVGQDEEVELIKLEELIVSATKYTETISTFDNDEDRDAFVTQQNELANRFVIRTYIPMLEKMRLMMAAVFNMQNVDMETEEVRVLTLEKNLFFNVLLGAYANVDVSNFDLQTYASYDLLYPLYSKFILQFCAEDYAKFEEMLDRTINFYNIKEFMNLGDKLDYKALQDAADQNAKMLETLEKDRETIKELKEIFAATNPANQKVVEDIQRIANEEATKALQEQKEE